MLVRPMYTDKSIWLLNETTGLHSIVETSHARLNGRFWESEQLGWGLPYHEYFLVSYGARKRFAFWYLGLLVQIHPSRWICTHALAITIGQCWQNDITISAQSKKLLDIMALYGQREALTGFQIGEVVSTIPTIGFNLESVTYKNLNFNVWVSALEGNRSCGRPTKAWADGQTRIWEDRHRFGRTGDATTRMQQQSYSW